LDILNDNARTALQSGKLAHLVTVNPDGSPQTSVVWVGLEDDEIVCGHLNEHKKVRNVQRDPRVTVSMVTGGQNAVGLDNYLVVVGKARISEGGAPDLLQRLARVYLGPKVKFPPIANPPAGFVMRITPERVYGVGPWK
jgi:PPOX class probable F420-dependent enzyme